MCQVEEASSWSKYWWELLLVWMPVAGAWWNLRKEIKANRASSLEMFDLQERKQDARAHVPVVIEILEDLAYLEQAFIYQGRFIPGLEHRCPVIRFADGKEAGHMSIAERTHQLHLIARRMLRNCQRVVFLTPKDTMPKTVAVCQRILDGWLSKKPGEKLTYVIKIGCIGSILQNECDREGLSPAQQQEWRSARQKPQMEAEELCRFVAKELEQFQNDLEVCAREEFPTYAQVDAHVPPRRIFSQIFRKWWEKVRNF